MTERERDGFLTLDDAGLLAQSDVDRYRASGPGGQKRNKTDSAVRLRHRPTKLIAIAEESRSQHENRAKAVKRLRQTIALEIRATIDAGCYAPGPVLRECIVAGARLRIGKRDRRYFLVVAEVLDLLFACGLRVSLTARKLGVSTANLSTFLCGDVKLKAAVNRMRASFGIRPLK